MDEQENSLAELTEAARRVGVTVNEHVNSVIELAERQAEEIRHNAELDAEATRGEAIESAKRVAGNSLWRRAMAGMRSTQSEPAPYGGGTGAGARFSDLLSRFRGEVKSDAFITSEGHCAVCQKGFMAGSEEELRQSDWKVNDDVGLCPDCQSDGWQLPDGANLPFRRGGA